MPGTLSKYRSNSSVSTPGKRSRVTKKPKLYKQVRVNKFGFPSQQSVCLKYNHYVFFGGTAALVTYPFHQNSMYDPYQPAGGHQPLYFDQYSAIYNHWVVNKARIKVTFVGTTASLVPCVAGIYVNDDTTLVASTFETLSEQSSCRTKCVSDTTDTPVTIYGEVYDAVKTFGPNTIANANLRGSASSNPSETSFWSVFVQPMDSASAYGLYAYVQIEYEGTFFELKDIAGS